MAEVRHRAHPAEGARVVTAALGIGAMVGLVAGMAVSHQGRATPAVAVSNTTGSNTAPTVDPTFNQGGFGPQAAPPSAQPATSSHSS